MNIAIIAPETLPLPPVKGGAVQIYIDAVIPYLAKRYSITLFSPAAGRISHKYGRNVRHETVPRQNYIHHIANRLQHSEFDIIHVFNRPDYISRLHAKSPNSRFVLNLHNDPANRVRKTLSSGRKRLWCTQVDWVIANSYYTKSVTLKNFPELKGKINTGHLGVNTRQFFPGKTPRIRKTVLFIGRLHRNKGLHVLIKAVAKLKKRHPNIFLLVVGSHKHGSNRSAPYTRFVKRLARRKLGYRVRFTGFVRPHKIPVIYRRSAIFVCPSIWEEPFGRVNLEAMASGLPVVTSTKGGIPEAVVHGKTGFLVKRSQSSDAYAARIGKLLSNKWLRRRMGRFGRLRVQRKFTWPKVAKKISKTYQRLR